MPDHRSACPAPLKINKIMSSPGIERPAETSDPASTLGCVINDNPPTSAIPGDLGFWFERRTVLGCAPGIADWKDLRVSAILLKSEGRFWPPGLAAVN
jgi:hypothetical protein